MRCIGLRRLAPFGGADGAARALGEHIEPRQTRRIGVRSSQVDPDDQVDAAGEVVDDGHLSASSSRMSACRCHRLLVARQALLDGTHGLMPK